MRLCPQGRRDWYQGSCLCRHDHVRITREYDLSCVVIIEIGTSAKMRLAVIVHNGGVVVKIMRHGSGLLLIGSPIYTALMLTRIIADCHRYILQHQMALFQCSGEYVLYIHTVQCLVRRWL